ncbi:hypothetical protein MD484_g2128, partial [Candolleomyces efflorescens]
MEAGGRSTQPGPYGSLQIDADYHWDLATFIQDFQVEGYVFRVPVHRFIEESETFTKLHGLDELLARPGHGHSHPLANAIELQAAIGDFRAFLKVLYPRLRNESVSSIAYDEWVSVLKLSTQWHFNKLRKEVIAVLDKHKNLGTIGRIKLAEEHHISSWLIRGYETLVRRSSGITETEAEQIGWRAAIKLCGQRERRISSQPYAFAAESSLRSMFANELMKIQEEENKYTIETTESHPSPLTPPKGKLPDPSPSLSPAGIFTFKVASAEPEAAELVEEVPTGWGGWGGRIPSGPAAEESVNSCEDPDGVGETFSPFNSGVSLKKKKKKR